MCWGSVRKLGRRCPSITINASCILVLTDLNGLFQYDLAIFCMAAIPFWSMCLGELRLPTSSRHKQWRYFGCRILFFVFAGASPTALRSIWLACSVWWRVSPRGIYGTSQLILQLGELIVPWSPGITLNSDASVLGKVMMFVLVQEFYSFTQEIW